MIKRFIKISIFMMIILCIFLGGFRVVAGKTLIKNTANNDLFKTFTPEVKYVGFKDYDNVTVIKVEMKNSTDYYASFNNLSIIFSKNTKSTPQNNDNYYINSADPSFVGRDLSFYDIDNYKDYSDYLSPGESREYEFAISKGINFDKEIYDTNRFRVTYSASYYKYRIKKNTVINLVGGSGGGENLDNSKDPYVID
ncbi:hypothetical protein [Clostridium sp.]|uniref:hypothetical protein n=1 Tax=Clostridium sp. TaxID=1506 RepID=UPI00262E9C90|nr:hypothetical protein [Clostridium sp.]